ncbi:MAG: DJ-1/PfpI family protein [Acidobacteriales bacterium]|nr:DJ-1/PfpI family protein [Terriglobales bacterium]
MPDIPDSQKHLHLGAFIFPRMDQIDFTGPFEVLSRVPDSTFHVIGKDRKPIRDVKGLILTPEMTIAEAPRLDVLMVPGGYGQEELMDDEAVLSFIRKQAANTKFVFSVCTGALVCGAAGLLKGVRSTTHWASFHLLPYFGAIPVDRRVVVDGKHVSAAGVTAGIDGALTLAALLRDDLAAQQIQLGLEYAPEPPFDSGTPKTAPAEVLAAAREEIRELTAQRLATAIRIGRELGVDVERIGTAVAEAP